MRPAVLGGVWEAATGEPLLPGGVPLLKLHGNLTQVRGKRVKRAPSAFWQPQRLRACPTAMLWPWTKLYGKH